MKRIIRILSIGIGIVVIGATLVFWLTYGRDAGEYSQSECEQIAAEFRAEAARNPLHEITAGYASCNDRGYW